MTRRHFADEQALLDALGEDGFERLGCEVDAEDVDRIVLGLRPRP